MKNKIILTGIYLVAALLYIIGPYSLFRVCKVGDSPMKCHYSVLAEIGVGVLLIGIAVLYVLTKTAREKAILTAIAGINSIIALLIPSVIIGGCGMKTMACQSRTFPAFYVISIILILLSLYNVIYVLRRNEGLL